MGTCYASGLSWAGHSRAWWIPVIDLAANAAGAVFGPASHDEAFTDSEPLAGAPRPNRDNMCRSSLLG